MCPRLCYLLVVCVSVLGKIDRVSFGLLNDEELVKALLSDPKMPKSRRVTAIPFIGKDVPSQRSEFSHPDIVIGLTILAYRYEGLRHVDFKRLMTTLQQNMWEEVGPYHKRPSSKLFAEWVKLAGGKVRGSRLEADNVKQKKKNQKKAELARQQHQVEEMDKDPFFHDAAPATDGEHSKDLITADGANDDEGDVDAQFSNIQRSHASATDIWPLRLIDFDDDEQYTTVYNLLHRLPEMIYYYLRNFIFPPTMRHQSMKLAASGQDVGGEMLCSHRVGFSGTPSNLIPIELGKLNYEKGSDGQMIYYLTSPKIMTCSIIRQEWNPRSLLLAIASGNPSFSALIDTGALITGMSNLEVAQYLLTHGLPDKEGVVFLDELDRKMILVRATMSVLPLSQCGIPDTKRFAFYDQVHTTGMDIQHSVNACAVITLGKDMVFRDYAQGAFRMRGIGRGQTLRLFITPEIVKLMRVHVGAAGFKRQYDEMMARCTPDDSSPDILSSPATDDLPFILQDAAAWLIVNGMLSETIQYHMLCEQNCNNVWRKKCLKALLDQYNSVGIDHMPEHLQKSLDVFRERMNYDVTEAVPVIARFSQKLIDQSRLNSYFLQEPEDRKIVEDIIRTVQYNEKDGEDRRANFKAKGEAEEKDEEGEKSPEKVRAFSAEQQQEQEQEQVRHHTHIQRTPLTIAAYRSFTHRTLHV